MSHRTLDSRHHPIESCTLQLHTWRPFQISLDSDSPKTPYSTNGSFHSKRPCRADRATSFSIEALDMSKLNLFDDDRPLSANKRESLRWFAKKRRRRGSRSVSGRSSDRSGTHCRRYISAGASAAAYGTCSDFPMAAGTDSSGELFVNGGGDPNWSSDVSEAAKNSRRERDNGNGDKDNNVSSGYVQAGNFDNLGNESGYGSEPGYRGDAEFGYGDEIDEEEDDSRLLFWGEGFGVSNMERRSENTLQKAHHRFRRKKHDLRMVDALR